MPHHDVSIGKMIAVIGPPGSGKSTLALKLSAITGLPLYHLDRIYWRPGWREISHEDFVHKQKELISGSSWIIEGNYHKTLKLRIDAADTVIFLDFNRFRCIGRVLKRSTIFRNRERVDMAEGCEERVDVEFLKWIWNYRSKQRPSTIEILDSKAGLKLHTLKRPSQVRRFLYELKGWSREQSTSGD